MNRYFIAVVPEGLAENPALKQLAGKMKRTLGDRASGVRWVAPSLWHVTLQFLGELDDDKQKNLMSFLGEWRPDLTALSLRIQGIGGFPASDQARVLWLGVQENHFYIIVTEMFAPAEPHEIRDRLCVSKPRKGEMRSVAALFEGKSARAEFFRDFRLQIEKLLVVLFRSVLQGNIPKYDPVLRLS